MDLKMFSIPEPPAPRSEVAFVISRVGLESRAGLVELLVDLENRTEEPAQTSPDGADPQTPCGPGRALTPRQSKSPPPPYLFTCYLANVLPFDETWSEKATTFLKSVLEKPMSGLVEDVLMPDRIVLLDIPLISKFLSRARMAKKIEAGHFKSLVLSSLHSPEGQPSSPCSSSPEPTDGGCAQEAPGQYLYLELQPDLFENVEVTQVTGPLSLFCKLSIFSKELKKLSKQMQLHYNGGSAPVRPVGPQASGSPCAARDTDGTWRRSRLTQDVVSGAGSVEVLHVDHGETQLVPPSAIRPLHQNFLRIPVVTYHCALHGVHAATWHRDQMDYLKSLLRHAVVARFELYDVAKNMYDVTLFGVEAECINAYFTEKSGVPSELRRAAEDCTSPPSPDDVDKSFSTKVALTNNRFLQGSMSPKSENPPANRRTDDDKCVDKNCWPNPSPIRKENANSEMIQSGHGDGCASPQSPSVKKNTIHEEVLPVGSCVAVKVSFIVSPAMFFCQLLDNRESFVLFMKDLQSYYANSSVEKPVGDFCVAWHPDNRMWYRGRIIDHGSSMMDVRFIDYGQTCMVPVQDLRPIDPRFMRLNAQAFQCCLHNPLHPTNPSAAPWTEGATEKFHKFIDSTDFSNGELKCTVKATTRNPQGLACSVVDLKTPLQCLCNLLTQTTASQSGDSLEASPVPLAMAGYRSSTHDLEVGSREKVCVMCSVSVDHFYCQLARNSHSLHRLVEGVGQLLASKPQSASLPLLVDSACIARYTDNLWFRGQIKATHPELQVYLVDFGDVMSLKMSDVCPIPADCSLVRSIPVQAVEVGLFNVPANVPKEINDWFEEHAVGQCFTMSVVKKDSRGKLLVELFEGPLNVNILVREKMAKNKAGSHPQSVPSLFSSATRSTPSMPCASVDAGKHVNPSVEPRKNFQNATLSDLPHRMLEPGSSSAVHVSQFNDPSSFFVQLHQDENNIIEIVEKLNDPAGVFSGPVQLDNLNVGDLVSAECPDDGSWYRAVVRRKHDNETLTVQFIDFGNEATIPCANTCDLNKEFLAQPQFSIPCTFGLMSNNQEQWDKEAILAFKSATAKNPEKTYSCTFMKETQNVWDIVLEDKGVVLAQTLIQQTQTGSNFKIDCTEETCRYTKPDTIPNSPYPVYATCIVGPHFFWCQHVNSVVLDKMSKLIEEAGHSGVQDPGWVETLRLGSPCLALFTDDNQWYRAQVIRRSGSTLSVLFVDYGNEAEVDTSNVKAVPRFLFETAPQAFLCALEGFDELKGVWEESASDEFYELLLEKALVVTPLNVGDNLYTAIPQYTVKVEIGETMVNKVMENYWKVSGDSSQESPITCAKDPVITKLLNAFT